MHGMSQRKYKFNQYLVIDVYLHFLFDQNLIMHLSRAQTMKSN